MKKEQNALIKREPALSDLDEALELAAVQLQGGAQPGYDPAGGIHLGDYWRAVRKRLWLVLGITLISTVLAAIYMARKQDVYTAEARLQVDLESSLTGGSGSKGSQVILSAPNDPNYFNTQLQILAGPGLLRRVARTLDLEHNPEFFRLPDTQRRSTWQNLLRMFNLGGRNEAPSDAPPITYTAADAKSIPPPSFREDQADAERLQPYVEYLQRSLKIDPVRETRLIDISFSHSDPGIASKVVNTIADTFVLSNLEKKTDTNSSEGDFLQKRIAELQAQMRNGEERLVNYAKNNQIISLDGNQNTVVERLVSLNQQLLTAESERKTAEAAYKAAQAPGAADALVKSSAGAAQGAMAQLRMRRAQLLARTTEEWPEVKEIDRQIAELERQNKESRNENVSTLLTNLKTQYLQALAREQSVRSSFETQKGETLTQNWAAINYKILQQEVETNKGLLDALLQKSKENDVIMAGTANNIHVVDYAVRPRSPLGINRLMGVMVAFPLSLAFGLGLALFLEYLDDTVKSESDVDKYLRLPTIGVIPSLQSLNSRRLLSGKYRNSSSLAKRNTNGATNVIITDDPRSPLAEAYRHLRTSLLLSSVGGPPKTVLITSTLPGEGKTTTAVNLAVTLAQGGAKVLLIDGDLRQPSLQTFFKLHNERGLSTIISTDANAEEVNDMIAHDQESGLYVLTAGPMPPNPADHLGSEKMRLLLKMFESNYGHVVIDSPPLSSFTDGILLSSIADSVVFVVQGGKGSREALRRAGRMLHDVGASITGVVLNNVQLSSHDRYYYYDRYYRDIDRANGANGDGTNGMDGNNGNGAWKEAVTKRGEIV